MTALPERCDACGQVITILARAALARRARLRHLMRAGRAVSQEAVARILGTNQVTVCRDLKALGAVRRASADWALPEPQSQPKRGRNR